MNHIQVWNMYSVAISKGMPVIPEFDSKPPICKVWPVCIDKVNNSCKLIHTDTARFIIRMARLNFKNRFAKAMERLYKMRIHKLVGKF